MGRSPDVATSGASGRHGSPWRAAGFLLVALFALVGSGMVVAALRLEPAQPPQPPPAAAPSWDAPVPIIAPEPAASPADDRPADRRDLPAPSASTSPTRPAGVRIPRIGVDAKIMNVGVDAKGVVRMPPLEQADLVGWYDRGPTPGEVGNSVLVGHVDSYTTGPAVFFKLGALRPGDRIEVSRKDGSVARFIVDGVASYARDQFPSALVYGPSDHAGLRLITCGGKYDPKTREYSHNVIVFATLDPQSPV